MTRRNRNESTHTQGLRNRLRLLIQRSKDTRLTAAERANLESEIAAFRNIIQDEAEPTPGFGCRIHENTELSSGVLILEHADGTYEPVSAVATLSEAREIAAAEMAAEGGRQDGDTFKVWSRGVEGKYLVNDCF